MSGIGPGNPGNCRLAGQGHPTCIMAFNVPHIPPIVKTLLEVFPDPEESLRIAERDYGSASVARRKPHGNWLRYSAPATGFDSTPMPSISTSIRSPARRKTGGCRAMPTPSGVPVRMTVPGSRVNWCDR